MKLKYSGFWKCLLIFLILISGFYNSTICRNDENHKNKVDDISTKDSQFLGLQNSGIKKIITGIITTDEGETIPGVNIVIEGTKTGVISDANGQYTIEVPEDSQFLEFSFIGYVTEKIPINESTEINMMLIPDILSLNEVVVIGYGKVKRSDLTGSVATITSKDYEKQPITRVDQLLQGRSSGVQVTNNSGAPGADVRIRIRGANSINGDNNPLIVVDGIIGVEYNDINTNDIESVEILKDASSTAIYGSRGANGVVLITTKSGKKDEKLNLSFSTFYSVSELPKKLDYLNAYDFASLYNAYFEELNYNAVFTDEEVENFKTNGGTDWQDEVFRKGNTKSYVLSLTGGSKKTSYFVSGEYIDQNGILINTNFNRFSIRTKIESELTNKLKVGINLSGNRRFAHNVNDVGSQMQTIGRLPQWVATEPIWDIEDVLYNNPPQYGASDGNPVGLQKSRNSDWITNTVLTNAHINYTVFTGLEISGSISADLRNETNNVFNNNLLLYGSESQSGQSSASIDNSQRIRTQGNFIINYSKEFGKHKLQLTAIYEEAATKEEGSHAGANNLTSISYGYHNLALSSSSNIGSYYYDEYMRSYAGRLNYVYFGKYLVTGTFRTDGSSKFKGNNKYSYFPSAAIGWNISEEQFIKNLNIFSSLKIRASWGITGSQATGSYGTLPDFIQNNNTYYAINGATSNVAGVAIGSPGNSNLRWESTEQKDIGLEMSFFNGRLNFEGDYYYKLTSHLLLPYELPDYAGGATIIENIGKIENKGFDFMINGSPVSTTNFQWKIGLNVSFNKNKVLDLGENYRLFLGSNYMEGDYMSIVQVGEELGTFYGHKYLGVWKSNEAEEAALHGFKPGDAKFGDSLQIIGHAQPDFTYGINSNLNYKNFTLNFFFQGVKGGQVYNLQRQHSFGFTGQNRAFTSPDWFNRWTPENEDTDVPAFSRSTFLYGNVSSRWLEEASFIRLKNVSLSYSFPKERLESLKISGIEMYISTQNLYTWTKYKGYDPEASAARSNYSTSGSSTDIDQNIDAGAYPNPRTYTIGLNVTF